MLMPIEHINQFLLNIHAVIKTILLILLTTKLPGTAILVQCSITLVRCTITSTLSKSSILCLTILQLAGPAKPGGDAIDG